MPNAPRRPWLAACLSLLCPGLGHVYCGRTAAGVWLLLLSLLLAPGAAIVAVVPPSDAMLRVLAGSAVLSLLLLLFAVGDAWRVARRLGGGPPPADAQRRALYAAFLTVGLVCPAASVIVLRTHVFEAFRIASGSMAPSLRDGDRVLVNKMRYAMSPAQRGDVVVFRAPDGRNHVKRVVAVAGDRVEVRAGRVVVNDEPLPVEPVAGADGVFRETNAGRTYEVRLGGDGAEAASMAEVRLGVAEVFVLGDDRAVSLDSRTLGPIGAGRLAGPAEYLFWSAAGPDRVGVLGTRR